MTEIIATITSIDNMDDLNIVSMKLGTHNLEMISLELDEQIQTGKKVSLGIKSTSITIAKEFNKNISCSNQIKSKITNINNGKLLSSINLLIDNKNIEVIITTKCTKNMGLKINDEVVLFIKENEISILEIKS